MGNRASYSGEQGILLARVFDASRERVWMEWTEPDRFADWFGGDGAEIPLSTVALDVTVGGKWHATMFSGSEPREIRWTGKYLDVVEPKLLVLTFSANDAPDELVTLALVDIGEAHTEMVFRQRGTMSGPQYDYAARGMSSFLDRMARRLAEEAALD